MNDNQDFNHDLSPLSAIMATLRSPSGCPWDQQQSPESLKPYVLEETYELLEAIDSKNSRDICDELGDLLLQVVFLAQIFSEQNEFNLSDVIKGICTKMRRRHPHVFAGADSAGHGQRWEQIKVQELEKNGSSQLLARRLPSTLPALKRTQKLIRKIRPEISTATSTEHLNKGHIQLLQVLQASSPVTAEIEEAMAQQLYDLVGLAATLNIDAEDLLRKKTTAKIVEIDDTKVDLRRPGSTNS